MSSSTHMNFARLIPQIYNALGDVHEHIDAQGLPRALHHLIQLRASQINACSFCVKMHTRDARKDGETNERLDNLAAWEHAPEFTLAEKAALAWTEALTVLDRRTDYFILRQSLREHFSDEQIAALTADVAMINLWNRFNISNH